MSCPPSSPSATAPCSASLRRQAAHRLRRRGVRGGRARPRPAAGVGRALLRAGRGVAGGSGRRVPAGEDAGALTSGRRLRPHARLLRGDGLPPPGGFTTLWGEANPCLLMVKGSSRVPTRCAPGARASPRLDAPRPVRPHAQTVPLPIGYVCAHDDLRGPATARRPRPQVHLRRCPPRDPIAPPLAPLAARFG